MDRGRSHSRASRFPRRARRPGSTCSECYRGVSTWVLPCLENRPVVLTRLSYAIDAKSSYQKDAPVFVPDWIRTTPIWSEDTQRQIRFVICDCEEALLYIANMGSIP